MTMYFMWVSTFGGVISEACGYATEEEMWAGLPLFVSEYMGGDVSDSDVTGFRIDLATGETAIIAVDRYELERKSSEGEPPGRRRASYRTAKTP